MNYFTELASVDVSGMFEKKGKFDYLSWAYAVRELNARHPDATWEVKRFDNLPYLKTECGYFVEVTVTVNGVPKTQIHPVLDGRNAVVWEPNAFDINTSIQRCLVKAIALHGLGLSIYAGEDLWNLGGNQEPANDPKTKEEPKAAQKPAAVRPVKPVKVEPTPAPTPAPEPVKQEPPEEVPVEAVVEDVPEPVEDGVVLASKEQVEAIREAARKARVPESAVCDKFDINHLEEMPADKVQEVISRLEARAQKIAAI